MQAVILAAGMGKRLGKHTEDVTKCMVKVNNVTLIERMLGQLDVLDLSRIIIVVGYQANKLKDFISTLNIRTPIVYVTNEIYDRTNNIYSLYLAREYLLQEDTLLLESDLIFESRILDHLLDEPYPNLALVAKYESWMDGTVVIIDESDEILDFIDKRHFKFSDISDYYKTVNIYKFSKEFSRKYYVPILESYSQLLGRNEYYEQILRIIILLNRADLLAEAVIKAKRVPSGEVWYEIDDIADLDIAESMFTQSASEKLTKFQNRYGGYWRYPQMLDFCYLVNPYFPPQQLMDEIKANFEHLISSYPSGLDIDCLLAAKYFRIPKEKVIVGNGASELIKSLMEDIRGNVGMIIPTFEEYPNRLDEEAIIHYSPGNDNFAYTADDLIDYFGDKDISALLLINPDNPSGNYMPRQDVIRLAEWAESSKVRLIYDESFVDFADSAEPPTLLDDGILRRFPGLVVVKSISKSFGVPGLRLGVLASGDPNLIAKMRKDVSIWNINSFAEFFLQIWEKYQKDYAYALRRFKNDRSIYLKELKRIKNLRPIPTQANYVMCEVLGGMTAKHLSECLLDQFNIFIKDLSRKKGINGEYVRLAVRNDEDNKLLLNALDIILNGDQSTPNITGSISELDDARLPQSADVSYFDQVH
ncbi:MAG: aminotransferase class I/II-fold pyridoxal phosphate-dependent enzyme [Methanomassiliicoccaceae archaeon]|jgi:histidinol-phosphate/aromatic aminotransferase/cobyric acid decarboxylase-like protein/choline kinase|nr:aminotransferase class I/II-fold pyridoxal phosphate-dependent enzyme [Euryarchaeota archaeon]HOB37886.1 aminotransferase class I/II-fold pyridoxal phosphate-dependent enzyme [Methanomassiliicoccaceae archaeon]HPP44507.1 aminotransferase class I/II-fold pyridoxal phosphate-dependent enzyme [Methanomassiliicoccaceae archaeon]HQD87383.1 aminotransferase class I/II-fold pyridoxal phosphate-dependent enzyme [Methanomassiliicoccaceae archaeon]